jgi:hypothetical protein
MFSTLQLESVNKSLLTDTLLLMADAIWQVLATMHRPPLWPGSVHTPVCCAHPHPNSATAKVLNHLPARRSSSSSSSNTPVTTHLLGAVASSHAAQSPLTGPPASCQGEGWTGTRNGPQAPATPTRPDETGWTSARWLVLPRRVPQEVPASWYFDRPRGYVRLI